MDMPTRQRFARRRHRTLGAYPGQGFEDPVGVLNAAGERKIGRGFLVCLC